MFLYKVGQGGWACVCTVNVVKHWKLNNNIIQKSFTILNTLHGYHHRNKMIYTSSKAQILSPILIDCQIYAQHKCMLNL